MKKKINSTFWKYFKKNILLQFLPFAGFSLILSVICFVCIRADAIQNTKSVTLNYGIQVEKIFSDVDSILYGLVNNAYIKSVMVNDKINYDNEESRLSMQKAQEYISSTVELSQFVYSVYLYNESANMIFSNFQDAETDYFFDRNWIEMYQKDMMHPMAMYVNNGEEYISFIYPFIQYREKTGAIAINVRVSEINSLYQTNNDKYYILNRSGEVIYSNSNKASVNIAKINQIQLNDKQVYTKILGNRFVGIYPISNLRYMLVVDMSNSEFVILNFLYQFIIIFYTIIVFIVVYSLSKRYAQHYYNNISEVVEMLSVYDNESDLIKRADEFEYIKNNVSMIVSENLEKEVQLSKKIIQLKQSQLNALQTQISPHFVLNALNVVNLLLIKSGDLHNDALKINESIAKILTQVLSSEKYLISIKEEIQCTNDYIDIAKIRRKNSFKVEWDIDEKCLNVQTIKFILQPIVENSIEHGFAKCKEREKMIKIQINTTDTDVEFMISDNGCGMSAQKLEEVQKMLSSKAFPIKRNIAVLNVHQRIQLVYGEEYGLNIIRSDELGTLIKMTIPKDNLDTL